VTQATASLEQSVQLGYITQQQASLQQTWMEQIIRLAVADKSRSAVAGGMSMNSGAYNTSLLNSGLMFGSTSGGRAEERHHMDRVTWDCMG